jgi:hypothetical protein
MNAAPHGVLAGSILPHADRRAVLAFATNSAIADASGVVHQLDIEGADLTFLASGKAPLLADHRAYLDGILGVVESVWLEPGAACAVVRFGNSAAARDAWADVAAGILTNVSAGYRIREAVPSEDGRRLTVTRWWPYEVSLVAIPADIGATVRGVMSNAIVAAEAAERQAAFAATQAARRNAALRAPAWQAWAASAAEPLAEVSGASLARLAPALARMVEEHLAELSVQP